MLNFSRYFLNFATLSCMKAFYSMICLLCCNLLSAKEPFVLPENTLIVQLSLPRTGSTLLFNVLQHLFTSTNETPAVIKAHSHKDIKPLMTKGANLYIISSLRPPLDQLASRVLTYGIDIKDPHLLLKELKKIVKQQKKLIRIVTSHRQSLLLNYDSFSELDYIFENLESFFKITIAEEERSYMKANFSKARLKTISDSLEDFSQIDPSTQIHGNHIHESSPGYWKEIIDPSFHALLERSAKS